MIVNYQIDTKFSDKRPYKKYTEKIYMGELKKPIKDRVRNWSCVATSQGRPAAARSWKGHEKIVPLEHLVGTWLF